MSSVHNAVSGSANAVVETAAANVVAPGPVQVVVAAGSAPTTYTVPFLVSLNSGAPVTTIDLRANRTLATLFAFFETVDLLSWDVTVTTMRSEKASVAWGFHVKSSTPNTQLAAVSCPLGGIILAGAQGGVVESFSLPPDHAFGRRVKGINLSTGLVHLTFVNTTTTAVVAFARMICTFRATGVAPVSALIYDEGKPVVSSTIATADFGIDFDEVSSKVERTTTVSLASTSSS